MTLTEMEDTIKSLDIRVASIEQILPTLATKDDLKAFATKEDLKAFATKEDLKAFATKEDLKAFATKDDLKAAFDEANHRARLFYEDLKATIKTLGERGRR